MIITSISFQNFYSFKDKAKIDFLVNENAPQNNHFYKCNEGSRFAKVSSIFGANGSGKTNLMRGFGFLKWFISHSFSYSRDDFSGFNSFETMKNKPSFFEVEFYIEKVFYKLSLEIDSERVLSELLENRRDKRLTKLYSRKYITSSNSYEFEAKNVKLEGSFIEKVRPNASVISTARQYNHPELTQLSNHWTSVYKKIKRPPFAEDDFLFFDLFDISKFYSEKEQYFVSVKSFLKKADLGLLDIKIEAKERENSRGEKRIRFLPYGLHRSKGEEFQLPFPLESGGTLHLYNILSFIFPALEKGSICLIDEIENNLHPNILPAVVNLFTSKETNPKGAQLICTTHMPTLMADLSKYQIFLVEKNKDCESEVYRLDEVQDVRNDDNLFKKYLAGTYGGIPDIDI